MEKKCKMQNAKCKIGRKGGIIIRNSELGIRNSEFGIRNFFKILGFFRAEGCPTFCFSTVIRPLEQWDAEYIP